MPKPIKQLADYFGAHLSPQRDAHERDRARQRAAIAGVFAAVSGWASWSDAAAGGFERLVPWLSLAYALYALFHLKVLLSRPRQGVIAQYAFIVLDSALTVLAMTGAPALLAACYPVLMVQIVRCGMRYGLRTMWLAWAGGALAAAVLMPLSPFWMAETQLLKSFMLMMLIVPLLFGPLIRTLHQVTDELRTAAGSDPLTGLGNRRMLQEHMRMARARSERDGTMLALIVFDLDNFKRVNDTLGHATGDRLLVRVAEAIRANCRASDVVARVGGDEFVLLIEGLSALGGREQAETVAAKILTRIKAEADALVPGTGVSASAGVRCWAHVVDAQADEADLLARADEAMYEAKRNGKGCVVTSLA
jgi:diguanylate cyclase (GGDEF)-like protein